LVRRRAGGGLGNGASPRSHQAVLLARTTGKSMSISATTEPAIAPMDRYLFRSTSKDN
jgi:hypothetical protein